MVACDSPGRGEYRQVNHEGAARVQRQTMWQGC